MYIELICNLMCSFDSWFFPPFRLRDLYGMTKKDDFQNIMIFCLSLNEYVVN